MNLTTFWLTLYVLVACLAIGRSFPIQGIREGDHVPSVMRDTAARPVEAALSVKEEAVKVVEDALSIGVDTNFNLTRAQSTASTAEELASQQLQTASDQCGYERLMNLGECGCSLARKLEMIDEALSASCSTYFGSTDAPFEERCSSFTDNNGDFRVPILLHEFKETMKTCSASYSVRDSEVPKETLALEAAVERQIPVASQIKNLLKVLNQLNNLLGSLVAKRTPQTRRTVTRIVKEGLNPKTARLIAYNNITVLPPTTA